MNKTIDLNNIGINDIVLVLTQEYPVWMIIGFCISCFLLGILTHKTYITLKQKIKQQKLFKRAKKIEKIRKEKDLIDSHRPKDKSIDKWDDSVGKLTDDSLRL